MPCYYDVVPGATQTTNASGGTENDAFFVKPGTSNVYITGVFPSGKANASTSISGITYRLKTWTSTASSAGTAITPTPKTVGFQASKHTAAYSATTLTSGTGGPLFNGSFGSGTSTPGPWFSDNPDRWYELEGAATKSIDIFNSSPAVSQVFEMFVTTAE